MSLAIVERNNGGQQRPVSGCVGVLFLHLLDWNRRLARKKKKNKRSLLPPILKRCPKPSSPCSYPNSPLLPPPPPSAAASPPANLTSPEEPQMMSTKTMQSPGLVARLMGLESMPVSRSSKSQKNLDKQLLSSNGTQPGNNLCSEARPLKMQKTSNRSGNLIIKSGPTHLKKHHNSSICFSSRSPRARLIQAASKILEPGLRPKLPLSPSNSSVRNIEENVTVGSLLGVKTDVDIISANELEPIGFSVELPKVNLPAKTDNLEEARDLRKDALNHTVQGRKCTHLQQKVTNSVISGRNIEINHPVQRNCGEQRKVSKNTAFLPVAASKLLPKTKISGANLNKRVTDKPFRSGYIGLEKNANHIFKSGAISNSMNTENRKRRTANDLRKKTEQAPFGSRSNNGVSPKRNNVKKRENNRASSLPSSRVKSVPKRSAVNGVENQTFSFGKERLHLKDHAGNLISSILEDLVMEVSHEAGFCLSASSTPCCEVSQGERDTGLSTYLASLEGDQPSPISILEASFSTDSCSLGSPVDESDCNMLFGPTGVIQKLPDYDFFDIRTETTSNSDLKILGSRVGCASEVISNIELLFDKDWIEEENFSIHGFLLDLLKNLMEMYDGSLNGEKEGCQLTNFLFDCIIEFLDCKYGYFCKSGYRGWLVISQSLNRDHFFKEILKEMHRWSEMGGKALYMLADRDVGNSIGMWSKCSFEGFEVGAEIENAIIQMLVEDLLFDLC